MQLDANLRELMNKTAFGKLMKLATFAGNINNLVNVKKAIEEIIISA